MDREIGRAKRGGGFSRKERKGNREGDERARRTGKRGGF